MIAVELLCKTTTFVSPSASVTPKASTYKPSATLYDLLVSLKGVPVKVKVITPGEAAVVIAALVGVNGPDPPSPTSICHLVSSSAVISPP